MPKKLDDTDPKVEQEFVALEETVLSRELPLIHDARIVYLGANRKKSVCYPGRVAVERFEQPGEARETIKTPITDGMTSYDFSSHDSRGRLIKVRMMPETTASEVRGRPFQSCEHPEHLRLFFRAKNGAGDREFKVLVPPEHNAALQDYIRRVESRLHRVEEEYRETVTA